MEKAKVQGGGGAPEAEGEAVQEEGDQGRAGEEACPAKEGGGGALQARGGREEGLGGGDEEKEAGAGRAQASGHDAGPEGEAERWWRRWRGWCQARRDWGEEFII